MSSTNASDIHNSPAGASKSRKSKKKKGSAKGKGHGDSIKVNGTKPDEGHENEEGEGEDQEQNTPIEEAMAPSDDHPATPRPEAPNGRAYTNGVLLESNDTEQSTVHDKGTDAAEDNEPEIDDVPDSLSNMHPSHTSSSSTSKNSSDNTEARLEALAQERQALREQVAELRRSLEEIQEKHEGDMNTVRNQLDERTGEKEHAETQYRNLLGKVNTIRSQLGERLKADAVGSVVELREKDTNSRKEDLAQAKGRIEELEEQCDGLRTENEARTAELATVVEEGEQRSKELSSLRNRTTLSQQNWAKEKEDLIQREAMAREEFEAAKQAMQDWEILAMEERSVRESTAERVSDLEEQLSTQRNAYEKAASERDSQSLTVDGLQRALQEIQDGKFDLSMTMRLALKLASARRKELRDLVENSQAQVGSLQKQLQEVQQQASEANNALEATQKKLERALPFEKEVKEKNLLIGKLRHEAVILNDHLTKALRYLKKGKPEENIDKQLVTNHFLHFLALERADPKKFQVLQIIAALLGWTDEQREQAGLARPGASNPNLRVPISPWHRTPSTPALSTDFFPDSSSTRKESLAELWSDFLEQEAQEGVKSPRSPSDSRRSPSTSSTSKPSGPGVSPKS
ncbi:MAG: hypothetical protein Q9225_002785 [Loekoesia sp. 1 TL-2023]